MPDDERQNVTWAGINIRLEFQNEIKESLYLRYKNRFDEQIFTDAVAKVDKDLNVENGFDSEQLILSKVHIIRNRKASKKHKR